MKFKIFLTFVALVMLLLNFKSNDNDRFKYYKPIGKTQEIEVYYLTWEDNNLPNFVKVTDYKKYVNEAQLIEQCFYVDAKDPDKRKFKIPTTTEKLIKKIPLKLKGRFYKTKQFDDTFPTVLFEDLRKTGDLKFQTIDNEYLVFVLD